MPDTPAIVRRREALMSAADISKLVGLEIGPYDRPIVHRHHGRVLYADMRSAEALRAATAPNQGRAVEDIVDVDVIIDPLNGICLDDPVDYVVASHVLEHIPDPVGWMNGLRSNLKPGGFVFLAVPDKRYTFDYLRPVTTLGSLIERAHSKPQRPSEGEVFDAFYEHLSNIGKRTRTYSLDRAVEMARKARSGQYVGCHCCVYTSDSFKHAFQTLIAMGELHYALENFTPAEAPWNDFLCVFRASH